MSEEANTRAGEEQESKASGLLLSVEPMQGVEPERRGDAVHDAAGRMADTAGVV